MNKKYIIILLFILIVIFIFFYFLPGKYLSYKNNNTFKKEEYSNKFNSVDKIDEKDDSLIKINTNKNTPNILKAVYFNIWSFSSAKKRDYIYKLLKSANLNSVVFDVKNSRGDLIFDYIDNVDEIISEFHKKDIYVIARIAVFQDSKLAEINPNLSLKDKNGNFWKDKKGYIWSDPASEDVWNYNISIAKKAIDVGFDEINYDYIRFPTDGNLNDIKYPFWDKKEEKSEVIKRFSKYSKDSLKKYSTDIKLSADIFGYTFLQGGGLGIGQKLEYLIDNFDYIYPMLYPSHYSKGNFGFDNPADYPYEVVRQTLEVGLDSLGEKKEQARKKIRPWLQAFDLGAVYDMDMINKQIKATYDVLGDENTGWLLWSPSNNYDVVLEGEF